MSGFSVYVKFIKGGMCAAHFNGAYMTRIMLIGLAVAGMTVPAYAGETSSNDASAAAAVSAQLANAANADQARVQLAHQGYTGISPLYRGEEGRWMGTAVKDGKTVIVAVLLPQAPKDLTN